MTKQQLADAAGVSVDMIAKIEAGRSGARFPTVEKLAEVLSVDPAELFLDGPLAIPTTRPLLTALATRLDLLSDSDLSWVDELLKVALKRRG